MEKNLIGITNYCYSSSGERIIEKNNKNKAWARICINGRIRILLVLVIFVYFKASKYDKGLYSLIPHISQTLKKGTTTF